MELCLNTLSFNFINHLLKLIFILFQVIYMNAFNPQRSPSPTRSRAPSPSRRPPTNEVVYVNGHPPAPVHHYHQQQPRSPRDYDDDSGVSAGNQSVRSTSKVHLVGAGEH